MSKIPSTLCSDFLLKWCDTDPNIFCNFCYPTKNGGPHFFLFPFVSSPWRNCLKIEGHHSIEMLHLNLSEMLFNIK